MKKLVIGIILLIMGIGLVIYNEYNENLNNIHDIVNSASKEEGIYAYLDATYIGGMIETSEDNSYYVVFGDGFQYIVYMNNNEAIKLNKYLLDNPESNKRIYGVTKKIPNEYILDGIKFANTWLDNNHTHEDEGENVKHDITEEQFYEYFGYVYLDNTIKSNIMIEIFIYVICMMGVCFILSYINTKYHLI